MAPWSKPIASMSTFQGEGSPVSGMVNSQLATPSARRCRSARRPLNWMRRMTTRCRSSGKGARRNSPRRSVNRLESRAQTALAMATSWTTKCGQGTQPRQPPCPGSRAHCTLRSPWMANGRPSAALARSLIVGFKRFQSSVARITSTAANRASTAPARPRKIFFLRVIPRIPLPDDVERIRLFILHLG